LIKPINYLTLFLVWLLVVCFAHDYVIKKINKNNHVTSQKIMQKSLNYHWELSNESDLVSDFSDDWQVTKSGLLSTQRAAEMSLNLQGRIIDPMIQQTLSLELILPDDKQNQVHVKFEFSNQMEPIFYGSADIELFSNKPTFDLNSIQWQLTDTTLGASSKTIKTWSDLGALDALVMRFYLKKPDSLLVKSVTLNQTVLDNPPQGVLCQSEFESTLSCHFTNRIKQHEQQYQYAGNLKQLYFSPFSQRPADIWLLAAWVFCLFALTSMSEYKQSFSYLLITLFFVVVSLLHQPWFGQYFKWFNGPLMLGFVSLLIVYRRHFLWPKDGVLWLWGVSMSLAVVLIYFSGWQLEFIRYFPQYLIWAWVQQLMLGPVVSTYFYQRLGTSKFMTACLVGVLFSSIHAPNHLLMLATLLSGILWSWSWLRYKNMYVNTFSHALLALVFYQAIPASWLGSARIGVFF